MTPPRQCAEVRSLRVQCALPFHHAGPCVYLPPSDIERACAVEFIRRAAAPLCAAPAGSAEHKCGTALALAAAMIERGHHRRA